MVSSASGSQHKGAILLAQPLAEYDLSRTAQRAFPRATSATIGFVGIVAAGWFIASCNQLSERHDFARRAVTGQQIAPNAVARVYGEPNVTRRASIRRILAPMRTRSNFGSASRRSVSGARYCARGRTIKRLDAVQGGDVIALEDGIGGSGPGIGKVLYAIYDNGRAAEPECQRPCWLPSGGHGARAQYRAKRVAVVVEE